MRLINADTVKAAISLHLMMAKVLILPEVDEELESGIDGLCQSLMRIVDQAPTAFDWTPCSDDLMPKKYTDVLVTVKYNDRLHVDVGCLLDVLPDDKGWDLRKDEGYFGLGREVIAWMPLPKAWEGES